MHLYMRSEAKAPKELKRGLDEMSLKAERNHGNQQRTKPDRTSTAKEVHQTHSKAPEWSPWGDSFVFHKPNIPKRCYNHVRTSQQLAPDKNKKIKMVHSSFGSSKIMAEVAYSNQSVRAAVLLSHNPHFPDQSSH